MICVIVFDAADVGLLERMTAEGRMPTLASLGARRPLGSPAVDLAPASFTTLYTGLGPGEHGHVYPFQWHAPEGRIVIARGLGSPKAVWERASAAGRRVLVIDPYESPEPASIPNGIVLSGIGFKERVVLPRWSVPARAGRDARRVVGRSPAVSETFGRSSEAELEVLARRLESAPARTVAAAVAELRGGSFDLAWVGLSSGHTGGHQLRARGGGGEALERIYEAIDDAIGVLLAALPASAQPIVISPLGMDQNASRVDLLPGMLDAVLRGGVREQGGTEGLWGIRSAVPAKLRAGIASAIPDRAALRLTARLETRGIDRTADAFALPADGHGFIRLNLRGREPEGVVDPGDADELCGRIEAGLRSFEDLGGGPTVGRVVRAADLYPGPRSSWLPDLIVGWTDTDSLDLTGVVSAELGELSRAGVGSGRVGNHPERSDAWVVGGEGEVDLTALDEIADLARAISASLGAGPIPVPSKA